MDIKETLGDELHKQVEEKLGEDMSKLIINDGDSWIPKHRFNEVIKEKDTYKEQLGSVNSKLEEFESLSQDNEELKGKLKELSDLNKKVEADSLKAIEQARTDNLLEMSLMKVGAKNLKAVKSLLDLSEVKRDGDTLLHLDGQLEKLKESDPYLFNEKEPPKTDASKTVNRNKPGEKKKFETWADWRKEHIGS